ncbi:MAG: NAD(P)/FAD-dependent oxidoreductase [Myxococcota bacterium]
MRADVAVIGGGHNGLVTAAYLARAGLKTVVLERRSVLGGACSTEEIWPGYRVSRAAYVVGLLRPVVARELGLASRGLKLLRRSPSSFTPLADGRGLTLSSDMDANCEQIRCFSAKDAQRYPRYERFLDRIARVLEPMLDTPPPDPAAARWRDLVPVSKLAFGAWRMRGDLPRGISLLLGAARPALEGWFESEPLLGTLATDAVIGAWAAPSTPGTGYVLFHHVMGETGGERGVWAYVEGGMGKLAESIATAASDAGATIRCEQPVSSINIANGRAVGVTLEGGETIDARAVVSGIDAQRTLLGLAGAEHVPEDLVRDLELLDFRSPSLKINLALDRLPQFAGFDTPGFHEIHSGMIHLGACTLDALEAAYDAACRGTLPELPLIEMTLPSALDPTLAPEGHYVASMFIQYVPYTLEGTNWDEQRDRFADRVFDIIDQVAPGFSSSVLHREVLAPPDIERVFGLTGGNIFQSAMSLDRLLFMRPVPGWARYRTPIRSLYLCGASTHPGGGVMGACGRNAAREMIRDLR